MSDDGADMGVTAERALETVLGGKEQPSEEEKRTPEQMRALLMAAPPLSDIEMRIEDSTQPDWPGSIEVLYSKTTGEELELGYSGSSEVAGRAVLEFLDAHPEHADTPIENVYADDADWSSPSVLHDALEKPGLYEVMKQHGIDLSVLGLTGFMWGWAYNAARCARSEPSQPNPAIVKIRI